MCYKDVCSFVGPFMNVFSVVHFCRNWSDS